MMGYDMNSYFELFRSKRIDIRGANYKFFLPKQSTKRAVKNGSFF